VIFAEKESFLSQVGQIFHQRPVIGKWLFHCYTDPILLHGLLQGMKHKHEVNRLLIQSHSTALLKDSEPAGDNGNEYCV